jgi:hypothetical protein
MLAVRGEINSRSEFDKMAGAILDSGSWRERAPGQESQAQSHRFSSNAPHAGRLIVAVRGEINSRSEFDKMAGAIAESGSWGERRPGH